MLPGVELARRRRLHYHGDVVGVGTGDPHHAHQHKLVPPTSHAATGVVGPALAARNRLQEKLRGVASPSSSSSSRWGWITRERDGGASSRQQQNIQQEQQQDLAVAASTEFKSPCPVPPMTIHGAEMRTLSNSKPDVCAVCLDEVRERHQRVTRLRCSHRYHSDCVLAWLAIQPDCPCCRTLVSSVETLS